MDEKLNPEKIMQVGLGFWESKVLLSAVELELFTSLAQAPGTLDELQNRLNLHPRSARDFLDALHALGFLQRVDGLYQNSPETAAFLDKGKPSYIGGMLEMANVRLYPFWNNLTEALHTGELQSEAKGRGKPFFSTMYEIPERLKGFLSGMTGFSRGANVGIAEKFPWDKYKTFVDVGTAQGDLAVQVALAHPHLSGVGFDLPKVGPIFEEYVSGANLANRLTFTAGNFFRDPIPKADVVMMGHILHDWNLEEKKTLITKAYQALNDAGALIVYESIIDDDRSQNVFGLLMSLNMLIETPGGFDYTGQDCADWMKEAGFSDIYVEHLVGPDSMVVGLK